jgi:hypothetical protein
MKPAAWVLVALLASGVLLAGVELAKGALNEPSPKIANPCRPRSGGPNGGIDATVQRVVLDGLDGAACRLHTTREELVLSLGGSGLGVHRHWDKHTIEVALRAGMMRSVNEAVRRGDIPGFLAPLVRGFVRHAPLKTLVQGSLSLGNLGG